MIGDYYGPRVPVKVVEHYPCGRARVYKNALAVFYESSGFSGYFFLCFLMRNAGLVKGNHPYKGLVVHKSAAMGPYYVILLSQQIKISAHGHFGNTESL